MAAVVVRCHSSWVSSFRFPRKTPRSFQRIQISKRHCGLYYEAEEHSNVKGNSYLPLKAKISLKKSVICAAPQNQEAHSASNVPADHFRNASGRSGTVSFYNQPYKMVDDIIVSNVRRHSSLLRVVSPTILVASFFLPSLYLRQILSKAFEDSLLRDFLILFFTEALFYGGVVIFVFLRDYLWRSAQLNHSANDGKPLTSALGNRISYVTPLVLGFVTSLLTMVLTWPWTGPAASAALAPYLVGIVVQCAFEQYTRLWNSSSWPVIPIIFQVYRLHQLNRAAHLVTALLFTVRGAEMTSRNLEIRSSLGAVMNISQFLGIICIWSLSSFLMKISPTAVARPTSFVTVGEDHLE